jgi:hypothetical protein
MLPVHLNSCRAAPTNRDFHYTQDGSAAGIQMKDCHFKVKLLLLYHLNDHQLTGINFDIILKTKNNGVFHDKKMGLSLQRTRSS